jgi:proteasome accessory factor B
LSDQEIAALLWASEGAVGRSPFRESLQSAATKLGATARQEHVAGIGSVVIEGGWGIKDYGPHRGTILRLVEAILRRCRCEVKYQSPMAVAPRTYEYDSYRIVSVGGGLYCIGKVPPHQNLTTLAVDRIRSLNLTDVQFEVDRSFDPERYRHESFGVVWEKPLNITIRFSADQAPYVRERIWHPSQRIRELEDGGIELRLRAGGLFELARWVLAWGDAAEVRAPRRLRDYVSSAFASAAAIYRHDAYTRKASAPKTVGRSCSGLSMPQRPSPADGSLKAAREPAPGRRRQ